MAPPSPLGRLARDEEFRRVYREGARRANTLVVIHARPNGLDSVRLGVAVGRRFGRAVERNRLRRRLREAVSANRTRIVVGVDLVVVPRPAAATAAFAAIRDSVKATLAAAGVLGRTDDGSTQ